MEDFKTYLMVSTGSLEWDNSEICKAAARDIMDHFSEEAGNMSRSIVMNSIYQTLYAGFDAVSDKLQEKGIDGINLWRALREDVSERYHDKQLVMLLATLAVIAQEARNYNDVAFKKYKETHVIDEALTVSAVERLVKMRPYAMDIPMSQYSIDQDLSVFSKKVSAAMFANTFRQFNLEMYNKDQAHVIFLGFYKDFCKSNTVIKEYGEDLIECAKQLISNLDENSQYKKLYLQYCESIKNYI